MSNRTAHAGLMCGSAADGDQSAAVFAWMCRGVLGCSYKPTKG
jgi:hypothetical protein